MEFWIIIQFLLALFLIYVIIKKTGLGQGGLVAGGCFYTSLLDALFLAEDANLTLINDPSIPIDQSPDIAPSAADQSSDNQMSWISFRATVLTIVILPFLGFIAAIVLMWGRGVGWTDVSLLVSMYVLTVLGITIGFHRLFTHKAFETNGVVQGVLAILGSMAVQGPLLKWVALHRRHHQFSDREFDPHSPIEGFQGVFGAIRGAWHSHIGWFFTPDPPDLDKYVRDLSRSALLRRVSSLFPLWVFLGLLIPMVVGGLITQSWHGAFFGLLWGGLVRVFLVHHVTWSVNSICHIWGKQAYKTQDASKNNVILGFLALGEGWHNNHHAFPSSARHGLKWWQFDLSYYVIKMLGYMGLARNIKRPSPRAITDVLS